MLRIMMLLPLVAMMRCLPKILGEADIISESGIIRETTSFAEGNTTPRRAHHVPHKRNTSLKKDQVDLDLFFFVIYDLERFLMKTTIPVTMTATMTTAIPTIIAV